MKLNKKFKIFVFSILIFHLGYEAANNDLFPLTHFYDRHFGAESVKEPEQKPEFEPVATPTQLNYSIYADTSQKQRIDCPKPEQTFVIAIFGQSNAANATGHRHDNNNAQFINFFNGACYIAKDPLLGAAGINGSVWIPFLQKLDTNKNILVINFAIGGSSIERWLDDQSLAPLFAENMAALTNSGYTPNLFMWVQGESNARSEGTVYETSLQALISKIENNYPDAKMGISSTTYCNGLRNEAIANVQRKVALFRGLIWLGNTDNFVSLEDRFDGCHFSAKAVDAAARMFADAVNQSVVLK